MAGELAGAASTRPLIGGTPTRFGPTIGQGGSADEIGVDLGGVDRGPPDVRTGAPARGRRRSGPCPPYGGSDRFHVVAGSKAAVAAGARSRSPQLGVVSSRLPRALARSCHGPIPRSDRRFDDGLSPRSTFLRRTLLDRIEAQCRAVETGTLAARPGIDLPRQHLEIGAPLQSPVPMCGPRVTPPLECEKDTGSIHIFGRLRFTRP